MPLQFQLTPETQVISGPEGIDLSVETHGDISAPLVVVMIHGGYQSRRCFKYQYPTLAFDHFVVSLDLPATANRHCPITPSFLLRCMPIVSKPSSPHCI